MTSDVAGVLCQDLNPPANVRSAVSLDEYCPVISQRITERYPTEKCSELRPEPSIAAAVLAVTGPAGVPIADDADVGIRIRAFESVYALLVTSFFSGATIAFADASHDCSGLCAASAISLRHL